MPDAPPFISMLALDIEKETGKPFDSRRLHVVYSFSKEWVQLAERADTDRPALG